MLIDLLPYAPKNVTQYGFAENVDGFSTGKIAQMIFWSTIAGPIFNKDNSMVADKTATGPVPAAPGQTPRAIQGGWGVGIPKNVDPAKKPAAWLALTWITSKAFNKYEVDEVPDRREPHFGLHRSRPGREVPLPAECAEGGARPPRSFRPRGSASSSS